MSATLFTYGVLMYEEALDLLTGCEFRMEPATLVDFQRYNLLRNEFSKVPVVVAQDGASVSGFIVYDVDENSLAVLDHFEDAGVGLYERIETDVTLDNGETVTAGLYIGTSVANDYLSGVWSKEEFEAENHHNMMTVVIPEFLERLNHKK